MRRLLRPALYRGNTEIATKVSQNARCKAFREVDRLAMGPPEIVFPEEDVVECPEMVEAAAPSFVIARIDVATAVHGTQRPGPYK